MDLKVEKLPAAEAWNSKANCYVVKRGGSVVGLLERYKPRRGYSFPWSVMVGVGHASRLVGSVYGSQDEALALLAKEAGL